MGSKNKLKRFTENKTFSNVIQPTRETILTDTFRYKGNWSKAVFNNNNSIILELGCGKGEYSLHLAKAHPDKNFIGIDIKGARFWRGAKTALEERCNNIVFLRAQIELIPFLFGVDEVAEIWITFPDPQIKYKRTKHRLINPEFLEKYKMIIKKGGVIHLKTDSEFLFGYTLGLLKKEQILYAHHDIYRNNDAPKEATAVQTFYEVQYLEEKKPITYIKFIL